MLVEINKDNSRELYDYMTAISENIPFFFPVKYEDWINSMFLDKDGDGELLFRDLKTYIELHNNEIIGFIQFGIPTFDFDDLGKVYDSCIGIIRNIFYEDYSISTGIKLIETAMNYFDKFDVSKRYAFYHYFGMSCNGRHGKLHETSFYIENLLAKYNFIKEQDNVYYSKDLTINNDYHVYELIDFEYKDKNKENEQYIKLLHNDNEIGAAVIHYVNSYISYLRWIYLDDENRHKGLGRKCITKLFSELSKKGYTQLDTDTASDNFNAQKFYEETGFTKKGITRSYIST